MISLRQFIFCLAVLVPLAACDSPERKEARYIESGNNLFNKGEYEKARVEYKNAARLKPTAAEPLYRLGLVDEAEGDLHNAFTGFVAAEQQDTHFHAAVLKVAQYYMAAEQYDQAHKRISAVLSEAPDDAEAHALNAAVLLREKNFDEAEKEAKTALAEDPTNISACSALTGIYTAKGDNEKAVAAIDEGIKRNPDNLALLMLRVLVYEHMENMPKIAESYQEIFKLKPQESKFRVDLASVYINAKQLDQAEGVLRDGIAALPDDWELKHQLVLFLSQYRSPELAEKEIKDLMQANPKNDDPYFWLADLYASHDDTDHATQTLEQIVARGQFDQPALNARTELARIDFQHGNKDVARKLVTAVLNKAPDNPAALFMRANLSFNDGDYQSAVADLRTIIRDHPKAGEALQLLGETLLLQGHLDLAIDTMKKLADADPLNFGARVRLAQMVHLNGDSKQAMEIVSLVTQADPTYAVAWESAARFAIDDKEWLQAEQAIRTLDTLDGQHPTATFLEGQMLEKNGKSDEAIAKYTEVINPDPTAPLAEHALTALAGVYQKTGHIDAAASYLEGLKSDSPFVATLLGKCYLALNKPDDAATAFDKAIAGNPTFQDPYIARAQLDLIEQKPQDALDILKKGTAAAPRDFRAPLMEANLLGNMGQYKDAEALYELLLERNPGLDVAANNLAELIADYEPDDSAALEKARQIADRFAGATNPLLLDTLAWVYYRQGNIPQAQTLMERATSQGKNLPPQIHYHFGAILMKGGKVEQAKAELRQAVVGTQPYPGIVDARKMLDSN